MTNRCLLCGHPEVVLMGRASTDEIIRQWRQSLSISVASEFSNIAEIRLFQCSHCGLQFYEPQVVGSAGLYEKLENYDWYYDPCRWEYDRAMRWIRKGVTVLEVGCGRGHFLKRVMSMRNATVVGLELNQSAVRQAQADGLAVDALEVGHFCDTSPQRFDVVCCFQVLEHVPTPREFLNACVGLLAPGGRLVLSVPNHDGFMRRSPENLWNQPPHHVTRWGGDTLRHLARLYPLELEDLCCEPLAACHVDWFVNVQLERLPAIRFLQGSLITIGRPLLRWMLGSRGVRHLVRGHSIFACYRKRNE